MKTETQIEPPIVSPRRNLTTRTAGASLAPQRDQATGKNAIRPFHVNVPEAELTELRRRINATKWPDRETVMDQSQGVQLATIQALARYWGTEYDWRKVEAQLKALPQFITEIDGLDIHFIHDARSYELIARVFNGHPEGFTRDDILDNITIPWLTNTAVSGARLYWENKLGYFNAKGV